MNIEQVMERYYANNADKLHKMVDGIIKNFGGLSQKDTDDFYSLANEVFWIAMNDFNGKGDFNGFLYSCLVRKIQSMITERNRQKRSDIEIIKQTDGSIKRIYHQPVSLDAPIKNDDGTATTYSDLIESKFDIWDEISDEIGLSFSPDVVEYLNKLPNKTRKIVLMIGEGYKSFDICNKMGIEEKEYQIHMEIIRTYEYIKPMEWRYLK